MALLEKGTTYRIVHATLRSEAESPALRDSLMPQVPYHPKGVRGSTMGVVVPCLRDSVIHGEATPSKNQVSSYEDEKTNSVVPRGKMAIGKIQESTPPRTSVPLPSGVSKMISPLPDPPPTPVRLPTASKLASLFENYTTALSRMPRITCHGAFSPSVGQSVQ